MFFWVMPTVASISNTRSHIAWQSRQYATIVDANADYPYLLYQLDALGQNLMLLDFNDMMDVIACISNLAIENNLHEINLTISEPVVFSSQNLELLNYIAIRIENEGYENNIIKFLYRLESLPVIINNSTILWDANEETRISLELYLFFH